MAEYIKDIINTIENNIYKYDITKVMNSIEVLFNSVEVSLQKNEFENIKTLNGILIKIEEAMNNKDYLLLADVLKFELLAIVPNKYTN